MSRTVLDKLRRAVAGPIQNLLREQLSPARPVTLENLETRILMARVEGIDVSQWQGTIDWAQVHDAGKEFAFVRATRGNDFIDPKLSENTTNGWAAGMLLGAYHFALPDTSLNDAVNEANWFLSNAKQYMKPGWIRPVIDVESGSELGKTALSQWVNDFSSTIESATGAKPIIYTNGNYATNYLDTSVINHKLWLARYNSGTIDPQVDHPQTPTGYPNPYGVWNVPVGSTTPSHDSWSFWQYTNQGTVAGITENVVDLNVFQGERALLESQFIIPQPAGSFQGVAVNFGKYETPIPSGYINFADQTFTSVFGYNMGWNDVGARLETRNSSYAPDQRYQTYVMPNDYGGLSRSFEIEVPSGSYRVRVVAGSPDEVGNTHQFWAEGVSVVNAVSNSTNRFVSGVQTVQVTDGRLTISSNSGTAPYSRLTFLDVVPADRAGELPQAPTGATAMPASSTAVDVRWTDNADNEGRDPTTFSSSTWAQVNEGYRIERRDWNGSSWSSWSVRGHARANAELYHDTGLTAGAQYQYRVTAVNAAGQSAAAVAAAVTTPTSTAQQTYTVTGEPWPVPALIQAEDFDRGGQGVSYNDSSGGNAGGFYRDGGGDIGRVGTAPAGTPLQPREHRLAWMRPTEWVEYTVNVPQGGEYLLQMRLSAPGANGKFHVSSILGGEETNLAAAAPGGRWDVPNTGDWNTFVVVDKQVTLPAGVQVIRVYADTAITENPGVMDVDWLRIGREVEATGPTVHGEGAKYELVLSGLSGGATWQIDWGDGQTESVAGDLHAVEHLYAASVTGATITATMTDPVTGATYNPAPINLQIVPARPVALLASALSTTSVRLTWVDSASVEDAYAIERSTDGGQSYTQIASIAANSTQHDVTGLSANTLYHFRVRATKGTAASAYSNAAFAWTNAAVQVSGEAWAGEQELYTLTLNSGGNALSGWTIDWGDGIVDTLSGAATSATHVYEDGPVDRVITATAQDGAANYSTQPIAVHVGQMPPVLSLSGSGVLESGQPYVVNFVTDKIGQDVITKWYVNWGDGSALEEVIGSATSASHQYANSTHSYTIEAVAVDRDGSYGAPSHSVAPSSSGFAMLSASSDSLTTTSVQGDTLVVAGPLAEWQQFTRTGTGTITAAAGDGITLVEGTSFHIGMWRDLAIPSGVQYVEFAYSSLAFDAATMGPRIRDAFEAALVDLATGQPVVPTTDPGRDAFFNITHGVPIEIKQALGVDTQAGTGEGVVKVNVSHLVGQTVRFELRLVNNDGDTNSTVTIGVAPNTAPDVAPISPLTTREGDLLTLTVPFTDPDADDIHTVTIDWGDKFIETFILPQGVRTVSHTHVYADDRGAGPDQYLPKVTVKDLAAADTEQGVVSISNIAPSLSASMRFESVVRENVRQLAATVSGTFTDPGWTREISGESETFQIDVNWGDGKPLERLGKSVVNGSDGVLTQGRFTGSHVYAEPGIYDVTVTVSDHDGGVVSQTFRYGLINIDVRRHINLKGPGTIPVEIISNLPAFDAATVKVASLRFGPGGAPDQQQQPVGTHGSQVNFLVENSRIRPTDTYAFLYGELQDGTPFVGMDDIVITPGSERGQNGVPATDAPKFFVADTGTDNAYRYTAAGVASGFFNYDYRITEPRGIAANPEGDTLWTIESNGQVAVHRPTNEFLGKWQASDVADAVGITTDGADIWIADKTQKKVFRYSGAAAQREGIATAQRWDSIADAYLEDAFPLAAANASPSDLVTDGISIWVVDDGANSVFKYTLSGVLLGSWALDAANASPSGIAWAEGQTDLWVVDRTDRVVYHYANATIRTSGSQDAASTFALAAGNASPEGIADPPTVRVTAPPPRSPARTGDTVLISGRATDGSSVADRVDIDGSPAGVVDVAGNFFARVPVLEGPNTFNIGATDPQGISATGRVSFDGVSPTPPGGIDFALLTDVTSRIGVQYERTSFNEKAATLYANFIAKNTGSPTLAMPLIVGVRNVSDATVRVAEYDGVMPDGTPYFRLQSATLGATSLPTDALTAMRGLAFHNPNRIRFAYDLVFLAPVNHAPAFSTVPIVQTPVVNDPSDNSYVYEFDATDLDGDDLAFSRISAPAGMTFESVDADNDGKAEFGRITWRPTQVGNYPILLGVDDGAADGSGQAQQGFVLSVTDSILNRPPQFSSDPVGEARIGSDYAYQATATDLDHDNLEFSILDTPPAGLAITSGGLLTWDKTSLAVGDYPITLKVIDRNPADGVARGTHDLQPFTIRVLPVAGNHPPEIISDPVLTFRATALGGARKKILEGRVRDFEYTHPDFEDAISGTVLRLLAPQLPADGTPVYVGQNYAGAITSAETFAQWYADVPGENLGDSLPLTLEETAPGSGIYSFMSNKFFPINGKLFGEAAPGETNFHFTWESHSRFTYRGGETLSFAADDDLWLFIDGKLAVDIGGAHGRDEEPLDLDTLGLTVGQSYAFDLFFAERHTGGSVFEMTTTLELQSAGGYLYDVDAIDADEDALTYSLIGNPPDWLLIDAVTGVISGYPTVDDVGPSPYDIDVLVTDGRGGSDLQHYQLVVETPQGNTNPRFTSEAPTRFEVDSRYAYQARATDDDGDALEYFLVEGPGGMEIERFSGLVTWKPATNLAGSFPVQIQVNDGQGGGDVQPFTVTLNRNGNAAPTFTSTAVLAAGAGQEYQYQAVATDPDNDPLVYGLAQKPIGMAIDPATGLILWRPTADQEGSHDVLVIATDTYGAVASDRYTITVTHNGPPVIASVPTGPAYVGATYQNRVIATDPEGETLAFSLDSASVQAGMQIHSTTGVFTWAPSSIEARTVEVTVTDVAGLTAKRTFAIDAVAAVTNRPPVVNGLPRATIQVGRQYFWVVNATDADSDKLYYDLELPPDGMTVTADGIVSWTPTDAQLGERTFTIVVDDQRAGGRVTQAFTVDVVNNGAGNEPPDIDSRPSNIAVAGKQYVYVPSATDPDGDPLVWALDQKPSTMSFDPVSGTIVWTPTDDDIGRTFDVILRVTDTNSASIAQKFPITVRAVNAPPRIDSPAMSPGKVGLSYRHQLHAVDPEALPVRYTMQVTGGTGHGLGIQETTGLIGGTPTEAGMYTVQVTAWDDEGLTDTETYTFDVAAASENLPPTLLTMPPFYGTPGVEYRYEFKAEDPEGLPIVYSLQQQPPSGTFNLDAATGVFTWTPPANITLGTYTIRLRASDGTKWIEQEYGLILRTNAAPTFINVPPSEPIVTGTQYTYDVDAVDAPGDVVRYELAGPSWLNIDGETGVITGEPPLSAISATPHSFTVTAIDDHGASVAHNFSLTVSADAAPIVYIQAAQTAVAKDSAVTLYLWADDDVDVTTLALSAGGRSFPIGADGFAHVLIDNAVLPGFGELTFTATAMDTAGQTATDSITIDVYNPADRVAPDINFTGPADNTTIYKPSDVTATISDDSEFQYKLEIAPIGSDLFKPLVDWTASPSTAGADGRYAASLSKLLDTTMMLNGTYVLRVTASDGARTSFVDRVLTVDGNLKIGNFSLSFADLSVPLAGIPINITRTYDTLRADTEHEFGHGWTMDVGDVTIHVAIPTGADLGEYGDTYPSFRFGTRVYVAIPGQRPQGFEFTPEHWGSHLEGQYQIPYLQTYYRPKFTPLPGTTSTLSVETDDVLLKKAADDSFYREADGPYGDGLGYNPALFSFGGLYYLTTRDGTRLQINALSSKLEEIRDLNGNTLHFSREGITSSTGVGIAFERDERDRITKITDPAGKSIIYAYTGNGNLKSVTDRANLTTQFFYGEAAPTGFANAVTPPEHFLTRIVDPRGIDVARAVFDSDNRFIGMLDAEGNRVDAGHGPIDSAATRFTETVTDALNNVTEFEYDERGNVKREVRLLVDSTDPAAKKYVVVAREYWPDTDELMRESEPFEVVGSANRFTALATTWRSTTTYENGLPSSRTDAADNTTFFDYADNGRLRSVTDALGHTSRYEYDDSGNMTAVINAKGERSENRYDDRGNLTEALDTRGRVTSRFTYGGPGGRMDSSTGGFIYDAAGNVTGSAPTRTFSYDAFGNLDASSYAWDDPATPAIENIIVSTSTDYDDAGRVLSSTDADGKTTSTDYNALGKPKTTTDRYNNITRYRYDVRGNLLETEYPDQSPADGVVNKPVTRTVYDALGRPIVSVDMHVPGTPANGTRTTYDKVGRVVTTERLANVVINVAETGVGTDVWEIVPQSGADYTFTSIISTSTTTYDAAGRADIVTGTDGKAADYDYDLLGRVQSVANALGQAMTYVYDAGGRQTSVTDAKLHTTTQEYDKLGRVVRTVFHDNTSTSVAYDDLGRKVSETDQLWNTTAYEYDSRGNLTAVVQPQVRVGIALLGEEELAAPRWEYEYDRYGNLVLQRDPQDDKFVSGSGAQDRETTFKYDEQNRRVERKLPLGQTESSVYDGFGRLQRTTDFKGQNHTFAYDSLGRVDVEKWFGVGVDPITGTPGQTVSYRFDPLGRQDRVTEAGESSRVTNYTFDTDGQLTSVDSPEGRVNYDYDAATGRHLRTWTGTNSSSPTTDTLYGYDELGRLKSVTSAKVSGATPAAPAVQLNRYDAVGNAITTTLPTTTYGYDQVGNRTGVSLPSGVVTSYTYDDLNRLDLMQNTLGATTLSSYDYTVRKNGMRSKVVETRLEPAGNLTTRTIEYQYDRIGRLTREASYSDGDYAETYTWVYGYDRAGNRTVKWNDGTGSQRDYTYDANDRLTHETYSDFDISEQIVFAYDANGSLIDRDRTYSTTGEFSLEPWHQLDEQQTYGYDLRNRLVSFDETELREEPDPNTSVFTPVRTATTAATYGYDHTGIRTAANATTTVTDHMADPDTVTTTTDNKVFLVDGNNPTGYAQVLEEKGAPTSTPTVSYVVGDDVISQTDGTGALMYLVYDGHGSTRLLTTSIGAISERYAYDAFGVALAHNPATPGTDLLYAGEQFDSGLDQYYLRARYYDQSIGRFSSFDSYEGVTFEPLTLHKYVFVHNDPISYIDPSGRFISTTDVTVATGTVAVTFSALIIAASIAFTVASNVATAGALAPVAQSLGVETEVTYQPKTGSNDIYFLHGTTAEEWLTVNQIDPSKFRTTADFGSGFYVFGDNAVGYAQASARAHFRNRFLGGGNTPIVLRLRMPLPYFNSLTRFQFTPWSKDYSPVVSAYKNGTPLPQSPNLQLYDVVDGPLAEERPRNSGNWVPSPRYKQNQIAFKSVRAWSGLAFNSVLPAASASGE